MKIDKLIFALMVMVTVSGCGFHLRGQEPLPSPLQRLNLQSNAPYSALTKQLRQALQAAGVVLASDTQAAVTLKILNENSGQQIVSQGVSGQLTTYLLSYNVSYQLVDVHGDLIQGVQSITATRNYTVSANQVLGDTSVQRQLQSDMLRDVINQLLQRLRAKNTLQALSGH